MKTIEIDNIIYKKLSEILTIKNGKDYKSHSKGNVPVYGSGGIISYIDTAVYDKPSVLIPRKGSLDKLYFVDTPFWNVDTIFYTEINTELVEPRYLYHYLKQAHLEKLNKAGGVPSLTQAVLNNLTIPLPPLPIQQEIVRILDTFTNLTAELMAELTARRKQYEYYRDELLTFGEDTREVTLREVVKHSCSGGTPSKGNVEYYSNGNIPWIRTQDVRFNEISEVDSYITERAVEETSVKWIPKNCVIVAISGASAGRCAINKIEATTNQHCLNMEIDSEKALYKYVFYSICSKYQELLDKKQGARGDLNSKLILDTKIALPDLNVQKYIVNILDKFNVIISSLTSGIPAEISARQKQYEYYRDQLLSFQKEKE